MRTVLGRVRVVGYIEGLSFLLLLFIAMPLKYVWGMPELVKYVGQAHGLLWVLYILLLLHAWGDKKLTAKWFAGGCIASVMPFGPFIFDRKLKALE